MASVEQVASKVNQLRRRYAERDARWADVLEVRKGNLNKVFPDLFPADYPKPLIANFIDVAARDVAEVIAPLPSFNCNTTNQVSDRARSRADKRTMIIAGYKDQSRLQTAMYTGADRYVTFGMLPFVIEPDYEGKRPHIRVDNPLGSYPEIDRFGRLKSYTKRYTKTIAQLCVEFPELASAIAGPINKQDSESRIEMYEYWDKDACLLFIPERGNLLLARYVNRLGEIPVVLAVRPGVDSDEEQRGQFDDVLWVQVARSRFATLALEAAQKSVQAPFALPADVNVLEIGPDATIRSATPEKIRRVGLDIPAGVFAEQQMLDQEMRTGARYPEGRLGNMDASIVTGRGVQALMGGFDTQVKTAQAVLAEAFKDVMRLALRTDEVFFGTVTKTVTGVSAGQPYEITYTPGRDIAKEYTIDVTYGLMAGLDPNRALVFGLQARGDQLISRDFLRRQMPWEMNVTQEEERIEIEKLRDSLIQAVAAYAQAIPSLVTQGADPGEILARVAMVISGRAKGDPIEQVIAEAFAPQPVPEASAPGAEPPVPGSPGEAASGTPNGLQPSGLARGVAPGQAGMSPGGKPALQYLLAGLSGSGNPTLASSVTRMVPAG